MVCMTIISVKTEKAPRTFEMPDSGNAVVLYNILISLSLSYFLSVLGYSCWPEDNSMSTKFHYLNKTQT
jgi:hypothetical protein